MFLGLIKTSVICGFAKIKSFTQPERQGDAEVDRTVSADRQGELSEFIERSITQQVCYCLLCIIKLHLFIGFLNDLSKTVTDTQVNDLCIPSADTGLF